MRFLISLLATACILITSPTTTDAHTWLECTKVLNPDDRKSGKALQCAGNIRGHNGRQPGQSVDNRYTHRIFAHDGSKPACKPDSQGSKNWYFNGFPRARVQAGERVAVSYNTNGHTNRDSPLTQSTYAFYWTGVPNVQLTQMSQLTPENRLTPLQNYDDCFAGEAGAGFSANPVRSNSFNIPGVGYYTIPKGTPDGVYQIVWHWSYDKRFPNNFNQEEYTSCFEVLVGNAPDLPYNAFYTAGGPEESNQQSPTDDRTEQMYYRGNREFPKWVSQGTPFWNSNVGIRAKQLGLTAEDVNYPNMNDFCRDTPRLDGMKDIGTNTQGQAPQPQPQPQPQPPAPQPNPQPEPQPPAQPKPNPIPPVIPSPGVMAGPSQSFMDGNIKLTLSTGLIGGCQSPAVSFALRTNTGAAIEYLNVIHQYGGVDRGSACSRAGSFQTITCIKEGGIPGDRTEIYIVYKIAGRAENIWPRPNAQGRAFTTVPVSCAENAKDGIRSLSEAEFLTDEGVLVEETSIETSSTNHLPIIIGVAVGATALVLLAVAGVVVYRKRQQSQVHTAHTTRDTTTMV